jgi:hypothetical protein
MPDSESRSSVEDESEWAADPAVLDDLDLQDSVGVLNDANDEESAEVLSDTDLQESVGEVNEEVFNDAEIEVKSEPEIEVRKSSRVRRLF